VKYPWSSLSGFPKGLVICVAIFLVSAGLCGLQLVVANAAGSNQLTSILMIPGFFELIGFWGSAIGIVVCLVGWIVTSIYRVFVRRA
jgi:hypothetical protein